MEKMFFNKKSHKKEAMELDITSLLDVLVILLVFLLKSYNASDLKLNLVKDLVLPASEQRTMGSHHMIIQVDGEQDVFLDNKKIGNIKSPATRSQLSAEISAKKNENKIINLVFDQDTPYQVIQKIMNTSSQVGLAQFKFIVKGNY